MKKILRKIQFILLLFIPMGMFAQMSDLIISEYGDGTDNNDYLEIYNGTGADVDLTPYYLWKIINAGNWYARSFNLEGTLKHGETLNFIKYSADSALLVKVDTIGPSSGINASFTFMVTNGNEAFGLAKVIAPGDTVVIDKIGDESGTTAPANWDCAGIVGAGYQHTWVRKPTVSGPNANWALSAGTNAEDSEWIIHPVNYWKNVGYHTEYNSAFASDLFFSEYCEGTSNNKALELYNGTGTDLDLTNYTLWKIVNEGDWYERAFPLDGILPHGKTYTIVNYTADSLMAIKRDTVGPVIGVGGSDFTFMVANGNEAFALAKILGPGDTVIIDKIGDESGTTVPENWTVAGVAGAGAEHTWIRKSTVCGPNADWPSSAGTTAEDSEWVLYPQNYWKDLGKHSMYCGSPIPKVNVTFKVDMSQQTVAAEGVHIAGDFQGWAFGATAMNDADSDGIWEITLELEVNKTFQFIYVNGDAIGEEETVPAECAQNTYRFVAVAEADIVLDPVCYGSCSECVGVYNVTFRVDMSEQTVAGEGVHIMGSFQNWDPAATLMADNNSDGIWEYTAVLDGNKTYQFKYVNGNSWGFEETVPAECAQDNNRFIEVATSDILTDPVCFGACTVCEPGAIFGRDLARMFSVFPNPSDGSFEVVCNLPGQKNFTIRVYNAAGKLVQNHDAAFSAGQNSMMLNIEEKGLYFVEIEGPQGKVYLKAVVN